MHKLIIKEFEFITLLALNIWAPRNHRGCVSEDRAEQVRDALFDDLHYLYCDGLKIDKYSSRMGEMMCLHTEVQVIKFKFEYLILKLTIFRMPICPPPSRISYFPISTPTCTQSNFVSLRFLSSRIPF